MSGNATETAAESRGKQDQPDTGKAKGAAEREYVVLVAAGLAEFVIAGRTKASNPRDARIAVAKVHAEKAELTEGIELRAIPASAFDGGLGTVRMKVEEAFVDG